MGAGENGARWKVGTLVELGDLSVCRKLGGAVKNNTVLTYIVLQSVNASSESLREVYLAESEVGG